MKVPDFIDYTALKRQLTGKLAPLAERIPPDFPRGFNHGDLPQWLDGLNALPAMEPVSWDLRECVRIGEAAQMNDAGRQALATALMQLHPWRKGPYELFGLHMDTEWRSDWKWDRLLPHISPLQGRTVLDVGCGNGYHCWRMAGEGARLVIGADSFLIFIMQYWAIRRFLRQPPVHVLPLALEDLPPHLQAFDTVFSMGVLYHRRSPFDHLFGLKHCLRPGGELVLETLVVEGEEGMSLVPHGRYARMPNVWFLPTTATLKNWLVKSGFRNVRLVDVNRTQVEEQRTTAWMTFNSLSDALADDDPSRTIEGYPAPLRAILVAEKPA